MLKIRSLIAKIQRGKKLNNEALVTTSMIEDEINRLNNNDYIIKKIKKYLLIFLTVISVSTILFGFMFPIIKVWRWNETNNYWGKRCNHI